VTICTDFQEFNFYITAVQPDTFVERHSARLASCARGDTICPRPLYAGRCGPAAAHTLRLRRLVRLASSSCGRHEYSRCTRQTSDRRQTSSYRRASSLNAPYPYGRGHNKCRSPVLYDLGDLTFTSLHLHHFLAV